MDEFRETLIDHTAEDEAIAPEAPPPVIGRDERRMQVKAYNYWASLLGNRLFPALADLLRRPHPEFSAHSVLLDFSQGSDNPAIARLGERLIEECGIENCGAGETPIRHLADAPAGSLLARISGHYPRILANQAPTSFEAEFVGLRDRTMLYRGILLPFSDNGQTISHVLGVINWKELADDATVRGLQAELERELTPALTSPPGRSQSTPLLLHLPEWADGPVSEGDAGGYEDWVEPALSPAVALDQLPARDWSSLSPHGPGVSLLVVRRLPDGELALLGEVTDPDLLEQAARQLGA